jgi:hypothetical protein
MAADPIWTTELLSDSVWAFERLLAQAPEGEIDPSVRQTWQQVKLWLARVAPLLQKAQPYQQISDVPPLHVTGKELEALVSKAQDVIEVHSAARQKARHGHIIAVLRSLDPLHRGLGRLKASSWVVAAGILCVALLDVLELLVLRNLPRLTALQINLGVVSVVGIVWACFHFLAVKPHAETLRAHLAHLSHLARILD